MLNALKRFLSPGLADVNAFGVQFPSVQEAKWLTDQTYHSPDLGYLEQFEYQLLFTVDDTRFGYERYGLIEDGKPLTGAYTQDTFEFWMQEHHNADGKLERLPIPIRKDGPHVLRYAPPPLKIKGEVHAIRPGQFRGLDDYKRNRKQFRRQRVNVLVPYTLRVNEVGADNHGIEVPYQLRGKNHIFETPEKVYVLRAWMYVGIPEYWDHILDAGFRGFKAVNRYQSRRPWLKEYYDFPKHPLE